VQINISIVLAPFILILHPPLRTTEVKPKFRSLDLFHGQLFSPGTLLFHPWRASSKGVTSPKDPYSMQAPASPATAATSTSPPPLIRRNADSTSYHYYYQLPSRICEACDWVWLGVTSGLKSIAGDATAQKLLCDRNCQQQY
jgi:hypothetical protein